MPAWLSFLLPRPSGALDRDPVALALGALAVALAGLYLAAALRRGIRPRAALIAVSGVLLVVLPTAAFVAMGVVTARPYGQDGGVVQLPLALDRILAGQSPYGADYSRTILGRQARVSDFWEAWGGNPILRHHAYLPGLHAIMLPFHVASRAAWGFSDPRLATLLAWAAAALLAARLVEGAERRLVAAAAVLLGPLVWWQQVFGANDILPAALLLAAALLAQRGRAAASGAMLGLACAVKQLAWPYAPFVLAHLAGARHLRELFAPRTVRLLARPALAALLVFAALVVPVAALDPGAFWADTIAYNLGLPGVEKYPLGGTPGFGFANFLICAGSVGSLRDDVALGWAWLVLAPVLLLLLRAQLRGDGAGAALVCGSAALLAVLYFSRVVHANYLVIPAVLLPVGALATRRWPPDVVVAPLLLLLVAVETAEYALFRTTSDGLAAAAGPVSLLLSRATPALTLDPLGLALSALAAGLAVAYLVAGILDLRRARAGLLAAAVVLLLAVPTLVAAATGVRTGVVRAQDPWLAKAIAAARPPALAEVREAWSTSFRREPAAVLEGSGAAAPGTEAVGWLLERLGGLDPRLLVLAAGAAALVLVLRQTRTQHRLLVAVVVLLSPAAVTGLVFGSPALLGVCALLGGRALVAMGRPAAAGAAIGTCAAVVAPLPFAAPFVLLPGASTPDRRRATAAFALGYFVLALPGLMAGAARADPAQAVGLQALLAYWGAESFARGVAAAGFLAIVLAAAWIGAGRAGPGRRALAAGAAVTVAAIWFAPAASAHELALPLALLGLTCGEGLEDGLSD